MKRNQKTTKLLKSVFMDAYIEDAETGNVEGGGFSMPFSVPIGNGGQPGTVIWRSYLGGGFEVAISTTKRPRVKKVKAP